MASPVFEALLAVQDHDTAVDRLHHRRETLPERAQQEAIRARLVDLRGLLEEAGARQAEAVATQSHLEDELAAAEARIAEVEKRMYSGEVSASRELQAMSQEVDHLKARVSELE